MADDVWLPVHRGSDASKKLTLPRGVANNPGSFAFYEVGEPPASSTLAEPGDGFTAGPGVGPAGATFERRAGNPKKTAMASSTMPMMAARSARLW